MNPIIPPQIPNYPKPYIFPNFPKNMTVIIGMKYKDGVVLIADRKQVEGANFRFGDKIFMPLSSLDNSPELAFSNKIAVGCAGWTDLCQQFNERIKVIAQSRIVEYQGANRRDIISQGIDIDAFESGKIKRDRLFKYNLHTSNVLGFLDDSANVIKLLVEQAKPHIGQLNQDVLDVIIGGYGDKPLLSIIFYSGLINEIKDYYSTGSGSPFATHFLDVNYRKDMTLKECISLGILAIKYCQEFKLGDGGVGLSDGEMPQIVFVTKDKCEEYKSTDEEAKKILAKADKTIKEIRGSLELYGSQLD